MSKNPPELHQFPLLPLRGMLVFPSMVLHLDVGREKSVQALEKAMMQDQIILLASQTEINIEDPMPADIFDIGTTAKIRQKLKLPNGTIRILVEGMQRARIQKFLPEDGCFEVMCELLQENLETSRAMDALMRSVLEQFELYIQSSKKVTSETYAAVADIKEPGRLADVIASHLVMKIKDKQHVLSSVDVTERLEHLLNMLNNEREVLELERKIGHRVKKQMEKTQKEYYLREQMKAIQKELGDKEGRIGEVEELRQQVEDADLPEAAHEKLIKEIDRYERIPSASAEGAVVRNYIDWLLQLPWNVQTEDALELKSAEQILQDDHFGLEKPKERVLEYLAVQKLVQKLKGPILCLVGPPGVGKTSLARSIARAMGRKFVRMSLGGVRDEAEIRGHRRTYVGAMPGRIIQGLKTVGTANPVFLLDEIDKMAADFRGDPSSALLEVLDPEQNETFSDHYVEIPFDLTNVMFVTTANTIHNIPNALLDRMEVLHIAGYTELEKKEIGERYLLPKQLREHGLSEEQLTLGENALFEIIRRYTREAGVRQLEQQLAALCRKVARKIAEGAEQAVQIDVDTVHRELGAAKYRFGIAEQTDQIGAATGLAWTEVGGDILTIEVSVMPGKGKLTLTGKLGDVMKESAQAAFSYMRTRAAVWDIEPQFHEVHDIHIHVPEGAIPKDGPSAGITIATALVSAFTKVPVSREVAMTGEITLRGNVLPIGGLKEKVLAAHRAGIQKLLIPFDNKKDMKDIPNSIQDVMEFVFVEHMDKVLQHALRNTSKVPELMDGGDRR